MGLQRFGDTDPRRPLALARAWAAGPSGRPARWWSRRLLEQLDVGEDVGLADAVLAEVAVAAVGPDRVDDPVVGGDAVVVADERPGREEPFVGVPGPGADPERAPGAAVVGRHRLPGVDVVVGRVAPAVEPDRVEVTGRVGVDPREELVVAGTPAAGAPAQRARVAPGEAAVTRDLQGDVGTGGRGVHVVLVEERQRPGRPVVVQRGGVGRPEHRRRQQVARVRVVDELARLVDRDRAGQEAGTAVGRLLEAEAVVDAGVALL